jgi:alcohol dehydrogenase class IV
MLTPFTFQLPTKISFGQPASEVLRDELTALGVQRALLVSDPGLAKVGLVEQISSGLVEAGLSLSTFTGVSSNPITTEVAAGLAQAQAQQSQAVVAVGGGSAIDVGKAIAMLLANEGSYRDYQWGGRAITRLSYPLLAVPTTAGTGSEVSKVAVIVDPEKPFKKGVLSPLMFPYAAVIDPQLTLSLPPWLTAATGIDAFTHALEAYLGRRANPFTDSLALAALRTIWLSLPQATRQGEDLEARQRMMLAATWAGIAMDQAGLGLIHALSGPLTSYLHLHHGLANGLILPYALRFNLPALSPRRRQTLADIMGLPVEVDDEMMVEWLTHFVRALGLPTRLSQLEVSLQGVDWDLMAEETTRMVLIKNNPRPATVDDCRNLLEEMRK